MFLHICFNFQAELSQGSLPARFLGVGAHCGLLKNIMLTSSNYTRMGTSVPTHGVTHVHQRGQRLAAVGQDGLRRPRMTTSGHAGALGKCVF